MRFVEIRATDNNITMISMQLQCSLGWGYLKKCERVGGVVNTDLIVQKIENWTQTKMFQYNIELLVCIVQYKSSVQPILLYQYITV